jgi:hypothetical protein
MELQQYYFRAHFQFCDRVRVARFYSPGRAQEWIDAMKRRYPPGAYAVGWITRESGPITSGPTFANDS